MATGSSTRLSPACMDPQQHDEKQIQELLPSEIIAALPSRGIHVPPQIVDAMQKAVEECRTKVQELLVEIASLHCVLNDTRPVNRLPPELLRMVFTYALVEKHDSNGHLIWITHVCKHWRAVALNAPALWTHFSTSTLKHPIGSRTFFERSKPLPVYMSLDISHPSAMDIFPLVILKISRIRVLELFLGDGIHFEAIFPSNIRGLTAPALEELWVVENNLEHPPMVPTHSQDLTPAVFSGVPALRSLVLSNAHLFAVPKGTIHTLNRLELSGWLPSIGTLLNFLRLNPQLESLVIHEGKIRAGSDFEASNTTQEVPLLKLRHLEAHQIPVQMATLLLSELVLPHEVNI
ncbi:hypothetical protein C8Q79DRAFT_954424 [Trametes meyenii]|nr:hypothetical protein C8Q79DRAFT_954424 [Trametes meyenii]